MPDSGVDFWLNQASKSSGSGGSKAKGAAKKAKSKAKATKSKVGTKSSKAETEAEKKRRRLERNRESARQSRRRKKQYLELLQEKVRGLTEVVDGLRQKRLDAALEEIPQKWKEGLEKLKLHMELGNLADERAPSKGTSSYTSNDLRRDLGELLARLSAVSAESSSIVQCEFWWEGRGRVKPFDIYSPRLPLSPTPVRNLPDQSSQLLNVLLPPYIRFLLWMLNNSKEFFKVSVSASRRRGKLKNTQIAPLQGQVHSDLSVIWPLLSKEFVSWLGDRKRRKASQRSDGKSRENLCRPRKSTQTHAAPILPLALHRASRTSKKNSSRERWRTASRWK